MKKKIVIKLGSSTLTRGKWQISRGKIEDVAQQILELREQYHVILVSSGAGAAAKQYFKLKEHHTALPFKQALVAIGQPILMRIYQEVFNDLGLGVAQCLLTYYDFHNETSRQNIINTIDSLLENDFIPIINENDTVATEEIKFGDNDKLAALTAGLIHADLLVLASDINGLYTADPKHNPEAKLITEVTDVQQIAHLAQETKSDLGSGGMPSKIVAAEICKEQQVEMWIVNGQQDHFIVDALKGSIPFTKFSK